MIRMLINKKLVDSIAMDIKAPLKKDGYDKLAGISVDLDKVKETITIIQNSDIDYEFITTVVPTLLSERDIEEVAKYLKGSKRYTLQKFLPANTYDKKLRNLETQSEEKMERLVAIARKYIKNVSWH